MFSKCISVFKPIKEVGPCVVKNCSSHYVYEFTFHGGAKLVVCEECYNAMRKSSWISNPKTLRTA